MQDVRIHDTKGWADLSKDGGVTGETEKVPVDENDVLWTEFKGREKEQNMLKEQKLALEQEEVKKQGTSIKPIEHDKVSEKQINAITDKNGSNAQEELRKREAEELEVLNTQAEQEAELDMMRQAQHVGTQEHLDELGLATREEHHDADEEEAMDI